jgi:hypothetical protein
VIHVKISDFWHRDQRRVPATRNSVRNGELGRDDYNDAELNMIIADSCGDDNAWCRDDPYHIDLAHASLNQFVKNGVEVGDMDPQHWGNRRVTWEFIPAPDYSGDIRIGFLQGAQTWWTAIAVSNLENGVHGGWSTSPRGLGRGRDEGDMGSRSSSNPLQPAGIDYRIRVRDIEDTLINEGRGVQLLAARLLREPVRQAYTEVPYTTSDDTAETEPAAETEPVAETGASGASVSASAPANGAGEVCQAVFTRTGQWDGGFQGEVTVTAGSTSVQDWTVELDFADGQRISQVWNVGSTTEGSKVTARNASFNGGLAAGTSTRLGLVGEGRAPPGPKVSCRAK